jgi:hypothetical protein
LSDEAGGFLCAITEEGPRDFRVSKLGTSDGNSQLMVIKLDTIQDLTLLIGPRRRARRVFLFPVLIREGTTEHSQAKGKEQIII